MVSTSPPTELHYLTLHTRPLTSLPAINSNDYESFTAALLQESNAILDHAAWSGLKSWHGGVVETQNLPPDAVKLHAPSSSSSNSSPAPKHKKKGFFGGGGGEGADGDQVDTEGCAWHRRCSRLVGKQANFEALWETLGVRHAEQEAEYVPTLSKVLPVVDNVWLKQYNLPFPTTNRSFLAYVAILTPRRPDEFLVVSFPVEDDRPDCPTKPLDKHHVRGRFVSVEQVRKVENDEVEWRCASMSFAAGSIPIRLSESHMASSLANNVPPFLAYLDRHLASIPSSASTPSRPSHGSKRLSMEGLRRSLSFKSRKDLEGRTESPSRVEEVGATA